MLRKICRQNISLIQDQENKENPPNLTVEEDQTYKETSPTQSAKSYPCNQQNKIQKEGNGSRNKYRLNNCENLSPKNVYTHRE